MEVKKKKKQRFWKEIWTMFYVNFLLFLFPLFYRNYYIDILRAKRDFFLTTTGIFLFLYFLLIVLRNREKQKREIFWKRKEEKKGLYIWGMVYLLGLVAGWLFSAYKEDCFWGLQGRYLGVLALGMGVCVSWVIAQNFRWNQVIAGAGMLSSSIIFLLQILDEWKIDPLGMKRNLIEKQHRIFTSTIGNLNFNATFNCMVLGVAMVCFILCRKTYMKIVSVIWLALGFAAAFCCRSDSAFLGIGAVFLVCFWYALKQRILWMGVGTMAALFTAVSVILAFLCHFLERPSYPMEGAAQILLRSEILVFELCFIVFLYVGNRILSGKNSVFYPYLEQIYRGVLLVAVVILIVCFYLANRAEVKIPEENWLHYFQITKYWGSNRGYVWKRSLELFREYSWIQKLFGCGANCFSYGFQKAFGWEVSSIKNQVFIDAHSEYLQMLMTTGIIGCIGYFGMIGSTLMHSIRSLQKDENKSALVGIGFLTAFLAQGLVNNPQIATTPFLFIGLGTIWNFLFAKNRA